MTILEDAYEILNVLVDKKAIDSGNRISRQEVFLESDLGEESFEAAYTYLRRELYVGAPINEEELWLTSSGVNFYENKRELRRKIPKRNILGILGHGHKVSPRQLKTDTGPPLPQIVPGPSPSLAPI